MCLAPGAGDGPESCRHAGRQEVQRDRDQLIPAAGSGKRYNATLTFILLNTACVCVCVCVCVSLCVCVWVCVRARGRARSALNHATVIINVIKLCIWCCYSRTSIKRVGLSVESAARVARLAPISPAQSGNCSQGQGKSGPIWQPWTLERPAICYARLYTLPCAYYCIKC